MDLMTTTTAAAATATNGVISIFVEVYHKVIVVYCTRGACFSSAFGGANIPNGKQTLSSQQFSAHFSHSVQFCVTFMKQS